MLLIASAADAGTGVINRYSYISHMSELSASSSSAPAPNATSGSGGPNRHLASGLGAVAFWGFSPAIDVLSPLCRVEGLFESTYISPHMRMRADLNILDFFVSGSEAESWLERERLPELCLGFMHVSLSCLLNFSPCMCARRE